MGYSYYDTPDGEDCFKKLWYTTKIATAVGLGVSTFDVLFYSRPQGYFQTFARYNHFTVPFIGIAAAFTSTVCVATALRKKDDKLNYFLGGVVAGAVTGVWRQSAFNGFRFALIFGLAAVIKKAAIENDFIFFPEITVHQRGSLRSVRHDYTITKERPRGWTTSEN